MIRAFPPPNSKLSVIRKYQVDSDALLRSVNTSQFKRPTATEKPVEYDQSNLASLTNLSQELLDRASASALASAPIPLESIDAETAKNEKTMQSKISSGDESDGFILKMIFDIVPIGVNIAKKGKTIATGFKETAMSIIDLIKNLAILSVVLFMDTFSFAVQLAIYLFKLLLCSVTILSNFPKCLTFYIIDILIFVILALIVSVLFIIDVFFMIKYIVGISCIEGFIMLLGILELIDSAIYSVVSFHLIHYPDKIINMCYSCSAMGDTSGFKSIAKKWLKDVFVDVPNDILGPIGGAFTGIGHIFSFLNI